MKCVICLADQPTTKAHHTQSGEFFAKSCDDCVGLAWESFFLTKTGATADEQALMLWRIKRRAAEAAGRPFTESPPKDAMDRQIEKLMAQSPMLAAAWKELS
jgi:hypothetical protein